MAVKESHKSYKLLFNRYLIVINNSNVLIEDDVVFVILEFKEAVSSRLKSWNANLTFLIDYYYSKLHNTNFFLNIIYNF